MFINIYEDFFSLGEKFRDHQLLNSTIFYMKSVPIW